MTKQEQYNRQRENIVRSMDQIFTPDFLYYYMGAEGTTKLPNSIYGILLDRHLLGSNGFINYYKREHNKTNLSAWLEQIQKLEEDL